MKLSPKGCLFKGGLTLALFIAVLLLANTFWIYSTGARLTRLRKTNDPEFAPPPAPEPVAAENNAYTYFLAAEAPSNTAFEELYAQFPRDPWSSEEDYPGVDLALPLKEEHIEPVKKMMIKYPKVLELLDQAAACSHFQPPEEPLDFEHADFPGERAQSNLVDFATLQAKLHVAAGEPEKALERVSQIMALGKLVAQHPSWMTFVRGRGNMATAIVVANMVLRMLPTTVEQRAQLQREIADLESPTQFIRTLKAERQYSIDMLDGIRAGEVEIPGRDEKLDQFARDAMESWALRALFNKNEAMLLQAVDTLLAKAESPYLEWQRVHDNNMHTMHEKPISSKIAVNQYFKFNHLRDRFEHSRAYARCLRVLLAACDDEGRIPESITLQDLELPAEWKEDPFNGEPLQIKLTEDGPIVYSIGANRTDDSGKVYSHYGTDLGLGPAIKPAEAEDEF